MNNLNYLNKYKLFIVDYDGTVLDSMRMWNTMLSEFLKSENIKFDVDIDKLAKEQTNKESVEYIHENYFSNITKSELENKMYDFVRIRYIKQILKTNADVMLSEMKKYGKVVLFSATAKELLEDSFKTNNINRFFDEVYSAGDLNTTKSGGLGYEVVLNLEGFKKEDTLVVEDVNHAIKGARSLNFDTLAIYDGQKSWNEIKEISTYSLNLLDLI